MKQEENSSKAVIGTLPAHAASLATNETIRFLVNGKSELKDKLLCIDLTTLNIQIGIKKYKYKKNVFVVFSVFNVKEIKNLKKTKNDEKDCIICLHCFVCKCTYGTSSICGRGFNLLCYKFK